MNKIIWFLTFPVWLIPLRLLFSRSMRVVTSGSAPSSLTAEQCSPACTQRIISTSPPPKGTEGASLSRSP